MVGAVLFALALTAQDAAPPASHPAAAETDASLTRIRARLASPETVRLSTDRELPEPTFRVEIHQHPYFTEVPFVWTFAGGGVPFVPPHGDQIGGTPLVSSGNMLPLFVSLKRALDERAARAEMQKAFAEFCETHVCVLPR